MMRSDRRGFLGGVAGAALAGTAVRAAAQPVAPRYAAALAAIRAQAETHRRRNALPALAIGLALPDGQGTTMLLGEARPGRPLTDATLVQIGSITKCMTGLVLHKLAAESRLRLDADIRALLPEVAWPEGAPITSQQLLDHVSGLSSAAPAFPGNGRLWRGFEPGAHWSYCNAGYDYLGRLAERIERKPLARIYHDRIFTPLGMARARGSIESSDRLLYAQGYEPTSRERVHIVGGPLQPAPWIDTVRAAGCVAATPGDMIPFMRALARMASGIAGLGLNPAQGRAFVEHTVAMGAAPMRYGNGLMHQTDAGRTLLHHTGGMPSFSSSMHVDADGTGAFASAPIGYPADYRPRLLTLFAVKALRAAHAGEPLPAPPSLDPPIKGVEAFAGRYIGPGRDIRIDAGALIANGRTIALQPVDDDVFQPVDPAFAAWPFRFERRGGKVVAIGWGPETLVREGSGHVPAPSDPMLARLAGRYANDSPWEGVVTIIERGGRLWGNGWVPITRLSDNLWRVGTDDFSPERLRFADLIDGVPQTAFLSENAYERRAV